MKISSFLSNPNETLSASSTPLILGWIFDGRFRIYIGLFFLVPRTAISGRKDDRIICLVSLRLLHSYFEIFLFNSSLSIARIENIAFCIRHKSSGLFSIFFFFHISYSLLYCGIINFFIQFFFSHLRVNFRSSACPFLVV